MKSIVDLIPEAFFDFFSYFLPGLFFILFGSRVINVLPIFQNRNTGSIELIITYCVAAYLIGHFLTAISDLLIIKPLNFFIGDPADSLIGIGKGKFTSLQARLAPELIIGIENIVKDKFKLKIDRHTFFLCENYVRNSRPDIGFLIRKRHAFEHMFRNIIIVSLALIIFMTNDTSLRVLFLAILIISLVRYFDYRVSWPKAVFENFYILTVAQSDQKTVNGG
jgi:hypothetical protein